MAESIGSICDLPPEVQAEILSKLEDAEDFQAVINTCPLWHDIKENRKEEMLFAQVLPILLEKARFRCYPIDNMLVLRQVCKEWKRATDRQLVLNPYDKFDREAYNFRDDEVIEEFFTHASRFPGGVNPLLGNYVTLTITDFEDSQPPVQLIHRYGTFLKTIFLLTISDNCPINELQSLMSFLPNLEWLGLAVCVEDWNVAVEATALPPIPLLKQFFLYIENLGVYGKPRPNYFLIQEFITSFVTVYGPQLETISCPLDLLRLDSISDRLPNLMSLEIDESPGTYFTDEDLHVLAQADWELRFLKVKKYYAAPFIQCSTALIDMLNTFSSTLTSLCFPLELERTFDPLELGVFPCLEIVDLRVSSTFGEFPVEMKNKVNTFSVVCPNLKKLEITTVGANINAALRNQLQFADMQVVFQLLREFTHRIERIDYIDRNLI
ncbi:unnamed protein product [Orchesella dallaii]|uniref:F-box domain-containing protein n=1 Tax=Orchesella dallaii TaxID=48710 RepID=A0ABP1RY26_9HEXA